MNRIISKARSLWVRSGLSKLNGILFFLFLYVVSHILWHFLNNTFQLETTFSSMFDFIEKVEAYMVSRLLVWIFSIENVLNVNILTLPNGRSILLWPDCTGVKHSFEIIFIMILYPGPAKKKLWYIPLSVLVVLFSAMVHFLILSIVLAEKPEYFPFAHSQLSRWIFFFFFFLIWLFWEEVIRKRDVGRRTWGRGDVGTLKNGKNGKKESG